MCTWVHAYAQIRPYVYTQPSFPIHLFEGVCKTLIGIYFQTVNAVFLIQIFQNTKPNQ